MFRTSSFRQVKDFVTLDPLDLQIIAALQVDARASFPLIASVLGEQERTVSRRTERLVDTGSVRLTAFVDELTTGIGQPVSLRISVSPGEVEHVAVELSHRSDTRAVMAVTGDADVCCELIAADRLTLHRILTCDIPAIRGISRIRTYAVLKHVKPTSEWRLPVLKRAQIAQLKTPPRRSRRAAHVQLSATDLVMLEELRLDARLSYVRLSGKLGVTSTTARRRLDRLLSSGAVSLRASVDPEIVGLPVEADVWLQVRPDAVEQTARRLAARAEVTYCGVMAGASAIELLLALPDLNHLYNFSAGVIAAMPAVQHCEPTLITRFYKRGFLAVDTVESPDAPTARRAR